MVIGEPQHEETTIICCNVGSFLNVSALNDACIFQRYTLRTAHTHSPIPSPDETYYSSNVLLDVDVQLFGYTPQSLEYLNWLNYTLDGQEDISIPFVYQSNSAPGYPSIYAPGYHLTGKCTLSDLPDGIHNVTVPGETTIGAEHRSFNETVIFTTSNEQTPETLQALQLTIIVGTIIAVVVTSTLLLVRLSKRKRNPVT